MEFFDIFYKLVYPFELQIIYKLLFAFIVGGIMGYTRTISGKPAGIRTQMLLCVGSTLLTAISIHLKDMGLAQLTANFIVKKQDILGRNGSSQSSTNFSTKIHHHFQ